MVLCCTCKGGADDGTDDRQDEPCRDRQADRGLPVLIRIAEALEVATDWILRANVPGTYAVANERIGALLRDCSNTEMEDLLRILEDVKKAIRRQ